MALYKIKDFDPDYRNHFDGDDVKDLDLYSGNEKIGSVDDVLVDEDGRFRYLVISTGVWIFGKKVLLPVGRAQIDYNARRVYANGLTKEQVEQLPEFTDAMKLDYQNEEQVRGVYRGSQGAYAAEAPLEASAGLNSPIPVEGEAYTGAAMGTTAGASYSADRPIVDADTVSPASTELAANTTPGMTYDQTNYNYDTHDRDLYNLDRHDDKIRLYQERLIASKTRQKAGEVTIGKHIETDIAQVSVPIEKERVVIERTAVSGTGATVAPGEAFREGEVARVEVYEETPNIQKEAFVREEVRVQKVVDQDTVTTQDQVRREELDIDTQGRPVIDDANRSIDDTSKRI